MDEGYCPICEYALKHIEDINGEILRCLHCKRYSSYFSYGHGVRYIGDVTVTEKYRDTKSEREYKLSIVNVAIKYEKDRLEKHKGELKWRIN